MGMVLVFKILLHCAALSPFVISSNATSKSECYVHKSKSAGTILNCDYVNRDWNTVTEAMTAQKPRNIRIFVKSGVLKCLDIPIPIALAVRVIIIQGRATSRRQGENEKPRLKNIDCPQRQNPIRSVKRLIINRVRLPVFPTTQYLQRCLEILNLDNNLIHRLPAKLVLPKLQYLSLRHNPIVSVGENTFLALSNLYHLSVRIDNKTVVPVLKNLARLTRLEFRRGLYPVRDSTLAAGPPRIILQDTPSLEFLRLYGFEMNNRTPESDIRSIGCGIKFLSVTVGNLGGSDLLERLMCCDRCNNAVGQRQELHITDKDNGQTIFRRNTSRSYNVSTLRYRSYYGGVFPDIPFDALPYLRHLEMSTSSGVLQRIEPGNMFVGKGENDAEDSPPPRLAIIELAHALCDCDMLASMRSWLRANKNIDAFRVRCGPSPNALHYRTLEYPSSRAVFAALERNCSSNAAPPITSLPLHSGRIPRGYISIAIVFFFLHVLLL